VQRESRTQANTAGSILLGRPTVDGLIAYSQVSGSRTERASQDRAYREAPQVGNPRNAPRKAWLFDVSGPYGILRACPTDDHNERLTGYCRLSGKYPQKTAKAMNEAGRDFAVSGRVSLPSQWNAITPNIASRTFSTCWEAQNQSRITAKGNGAGVSEPAHVGIGPPVAGRDRWRRDIRR
jgi:hypothetical protein